MSCLLLDNPGEVLEKEILDMSIIGTGGGRSRPNLDKKESQHNNHRTGEGEKTHILIPITELRMLSDVVSSQAI